MKKSECNSYSDQQLIAKSAQQKDYFACLYMRYEAALLRYIKRTSSFTDDEALDILQDSFIKIWKNLNDYDPELSFSTWAYRIVYHQTVSVWRKSVSYGKNKTVDATTQPLKAMEYQTDNTEEKVLKIMQLLPENYKTVLVLKYFEDQSYEEISDIMKIPEGTVATYLNRAKTAFLKLSQKHHIHFFD